MAIQLVSSNLNILADNGRFETDPSTWGQLFTQVGTHSRSSEEQTQGIFSGLMTVTGAPILWPGFFFGNAFVAAGRKYVVKAKVFVPTGFNPAGGSSVIRLEQIIQFGVFGTPSPVIDVISSVTKTVTDAIGTWVDLELRFEVTAPGFAPFEVQILMDSPLNIGGKLHCDEFFIYEYIDVAEECTLEIDAIGTVVLNETTTGANDGSIAVAITGGTGPFEYSKDGGSSWQASNLFTGLAPGVYNMVVRQVALISCASAQSFAVNSADYDFDFSTIVTNESVSGAADGQIEITVTGDTAPFTFSKNGGGTYQSGNIFSGLAPGVYTIVVKDADDIIRARNIVIAAGILLVEKIWHAGNPITALRTAPPDWDTNPNYRLYCEVRVEEVTGSGTYVPAMVTHLTPTENNEARFQMREAMRGFLAAVPPAVSQNEIVRLTDRVKAFKFYTGSVEGTSDVPGVLAGSNPNLVLLGGISKEKWPTENFFDNLPTTKKLFSYAPAGKPVDPTQPDWINYLIIGPTVNTLKLSITATYTDGTTATAVTKTKTGVAYGQLYQLPVGPLNSGVLGITPAKTVISYEVVVLDQSDNEISEVRSYVLDAQSHPRKKLIMFLNSLGSYEVIRFTGVTERNVDMQREEFIRFLPYTYNVQDGERVSNRATLRESGSYGSGYLAGENAAALLDYLKDLLRSPRIFLIEGTRLRPVMINAGSFAMNGDQNYERALRLTFTNSFDEEFYTP